MAELFDAKINILKFSGQEKYTKILHVLFFYDIIKLFIKRFMASKPNVSEKQAKLIFAENYGREVTAIRSLDSYDDRNYLVSATDGKYVLKIFNSDVSADSARCDEQCHLQEFWFQSGIAVPKIIRNKNGELQFKLMLPVASGESMDCVVRVLEFFSGMILY